MEIDEIGLNKLQKTYTREASSYDEARWSSYLGKLQLKGIYDVLNSSIQATKETLILDVAAGTGVTALYLARKSGKVIAIDIAEAMLRKAKEKAENNRINNIAYYVGSTYNLPYKDNSFNIVVSFRFMHLLIYKEQILAIKEMLRVLKPGGTLVVEFKNGLYGFALRLRIKQERLRIKEGKYILPYNVKELFKNTDIIKIRGLYYPGQQRLPRINFLEKAFIKLGRVFPFKYICEKLYVVCRKL